MSLYQLQKLLYQINRDERVQAAYEQDLDGLLAQYALTPEEADAVRRADIGELYIMGVNGQILMHYAAWRGFEWDQYIQAMKDALQTHGQVKGGLYAAVDGGQGGAV